MEKFTSNSRDETIILGKKLAKHLKGGEVIAYRGGLGMGKTCFTKGIADGLGYSGIVTSPTFSLVNEYIGGKFPIYHFDMYRIFGVDDLYSVGYFDYLDGNNIIIAEWSENIEDALPEDAIIIEFEKTGDDSRVITVSGVDIN